MSKLQKVNPKFPRIVPVNLAPENPDRASVHATARLRHVSDYLASRARGYTTDLNFEVDHFFPVDQIGEDRGQCAPFCPCGPGAAIDNAPPCTTPR